MSLASALQAVSRGVLKRFSPAQISPKFGRFALAGLLALTTAGCFQPIYGEQGLGTGGPAVREKLAGVEVPPIAVPHGSPVARIGVEVRNNLSFKLTGTGGSAVAPTHRLVIRMTTSRANVVVDINTSRPDVENYGIDAVYELRDIATGKVIVTGQTFARVSYDIPGQQQRFARSRGLRDAEDRAAQVIADNIGQRLAAYFSVGS